MSLQKDKKELKGINVYLSRRWESIKTLYLVLTWIVLGIQLEIVGPTLAILATHTNVDYTGVSNILIGRNAGYLLPNLFGAVIQRFVKQYPELLLGLAFIVSAIVVFATPLITNIGLLIFAFFFQGISQGITDLAGTSLMFAMWGDHVGAPLNVVHLGFGIGAVLASFLVKHYLKEERSLVSSDSSAMAMNSSSIEIQSTINIDIPYYITAVICLLISIGYIIFYFYQRRGHHQSNTNEEVTYESVPKVATNNSSIEKVSQYSPRSCGYGSFSYGLAMSVLWIFYMFFVSGNDQTFSKFYSTYLLSPEFSISAKGATWGTILYWLSYSIGRLICALLTVFLPIHYALNGLWLFGLILAIVWYIFVWSIGLTTKTLFILGAFTGLVFSPTFPLSFGFINQRLNVSPLLLGLILCGGSLGAMTFQKIAGILLDRNREHFSTLLIICVVIAIIFYISASILSTLHLRKRKANDNAAPTVSDEEKQMEAYLESL